MPRQSTQFIHEGKYAAQVPIEVVDDETPWSPTISVEEMRKLDRVRLALRRGDIADAAKEARIFELLPLAG